jgi:hypothetical protein
MSWTPNKQIPNQRSQAAPALAAFDGGLHMVHLGDGTRDLWQSTWS